MYIWFVKRMASFYCSLSKSTKYLVQDSFYYETIYVSVSMVITTTHLLESKFLNNFHGDKLLSLTSPACLLAKFLCSLLHSSRRLVWLKLSLCCTIGKESHNPLRRNSLSSSMISSDWRVKSDLSKRKVMLFSYSRWARKIWNVAQRFNVLLCAARKIAPYITGRLTIHINLWLISGALL